MNIRKTVRVSLSALLRNKMRSFLTALGIIIGVGAVIAMVSIGAGAKAGIEARFEAMGTNNLTVRGGARRVMGVSTGIGGAKLTDADAQAIKDQCPAVLYVSPSVSIRKQVKFGNKNWNTSIQGASESYTFIRNWEMLEGAFFDENSVRIREKICVLGSEVSENLFEGADPIGQVIRIDRVPVKVIGVLKSKGEAGGWGSNDDIILMPYTTVMRYFMGANASIRSIDVSALSGDDTSQAQFQIEELLRIRHKIAPGADDDFNVRNMADIQESATESTRIMTILLGGIAAISLLVGGIGIMNIMLVSVTERIREIGIRMSVGAKEKDILFQFLVEAVVLSVLGGLLGIGVGWGVSKLIPTIVPNMATIVSPASIVLAFGFSATVGIFFGFYPARKASRLDPIEALRYE